MIRESDSIAYYTAKNANVYIYIYLWGLNRPKTRVHSSTHCSYNSTVLISNIIRKLILECRETRHYHSYAMKTVHWIVTIIAFGRLVMAKGKSGFGHWR